MLRKPHAPRLLGPRRLRRHHEPKRHRQVTVHLLVQYASSAVRTPSHRRSRSAPRTAVVPPGCRAPPCTPAARRAPRPARGRSRRAPWSAPRAAASAPRRAGPRSRASRLWRASRDGHGRERARSKRPLALPGEAERLAELRATRRALQVRALLVRALLVHPSASFSPSFCSRSLQLVACSVSLVACKL